MGRNWGEGALGGVGGFFGGFLGSEQARNLISFERMFDFRAFGFELVVSDLDRRWRRVCRLPCDAFAGVARILILSFFQ